MKDSIVKILILTSEFPPDPGGIGSHAFSLSSALSRQNCQVSVITDGDASDIKIAAFDSQLSFEVIRIKRRFPFFYFVRVLSAWRTAIKFKPEAVLVSGRFSLWTGACLKLFLSLRVIGILHGSEVQPQNSFIRWLNHWAINHLNALIPVSTFTSSLIPERITIRKPYKVIPNAIQVSEFDGLEKVDVKVLQGNPVFVTVGNVTYRKGQHRMIQALPVIRKTLPDAHYYCIGIPTKQAEFENLSIGLNVAEHVTFLGKITSRKSMFVTVSSAHIFIMLSENQTDGNVEGYGIAILEANALGIPAIGAYGSGVEDAIKHGYNGLLVDGNNAVEITQAIATILGDWQNFSQRAKQWARQHDWDVVVKEYLEVIDSL